jgi:hypothetical protein
LSIVLAICFPIVLIKLSTFTWLSGKGDIGNAIGGITAPFVGLIGAMLVYLSFEQQIEGNKIQREALRNQILQEQLKSEYDMLEKYLAEIKDEFYKLRYRRSAQANQPGHRRQGEIYKGEDALEAYSDDLTNDGDGFSDDIVEFEFGVRYLVLLAFSFEEQLKIAIIKEDKKAFFAKKFIYFYEAKIKLQLELINRRMTEERYEFEKIKEESRALMDKVKGMHTTYRITGL